MDASAIREKIKDLVSKVTEIDPAEIPDNASFVEDLQLDSLSLLEIGVEVDYEFKLGVPEERLAELATLQDSVDLVLECMAAAPASAATASAPAASAHA
ncbi:MAG: acyl carrier protein [Acidobacteriota bacterium]